MTNREKLHEMHSLRSGTTYGSRKELMSKRRHFPLRKKAQDLFRNQKITAKTAMPPCTKVLSKTASKGSLSSQGSDSGVSVGTLLDEEVVNVAESRPDSSLSKDSGTFSDDSGGKLSEPHILSGHKVVDLSDPSDSETGLVLKSDGIVGAFAYAGADVPSSLGKLLKSYGTFADFQLKDKKHSHLAKVSKSASILSLSSGASVLTGYLTYKQGVRTLKTASKVNDTFGEYQGKLSKARAPFEALSGAISMPVSMMSIAGVATTGKTAIAASALAKASSVASGVYFVGLIASSSLAVHEIRKNSSSFLKEAESGNTDQAIEELVNVLTLDEKAVDKVLEKTFKGLSVKSEGKRTLDTKKFDKMLSKVVDGGNFVLHETEYESINEYVETLLQDGSIEALDVDKVKALMVSEVKKKYAARQQSFLRTFGKEAFDKLISVKRAEETDVEIESLKADKEQVVELAKKAVKNGKIFHGFLLAGVISALALTIVGNIFTGGILYVVMQAVSLATAAILTGIDFYALYQTYKCSKVNLKEKIAIGAIAAVMVGAIIAANIFSGGVAGIVLMSIVAVVFTGATLAGAYKANKELNDTEEDEDSKSIEERRLENLLDEMAEFAARRAERLRLESLQTETAEVSE